MAGRRTHVPKFGNWDANDHMPYTAVFDHARQGRGKPMNPNDPSENPNLQAAGRGNVAPGRRPYNPNDLEDSMESPDLQQEKLERPTSQGNREGSGRGQPPRQPHQVAAGAAARRVAVPPAHGNGAPSRVPSDPKRMSRDNVLERNGESPSASFSADQSPSHPVRATRLGAASPAWERGRKSTGEDGQAFAPATPNRSRLRTGVSKEEASTKGPSAAVPQFGTWDAQDPGSGDGFTVIFNNARNEKKAGGPVDIKRTPDHKPHGDDLYEPSHAGYQKGQGSRKSWFCCLGPDVKS